MRWIMICMYGCSSADVDGTLIRSRGTDANKLHKESFQHAFLHVFGIDTNIDVVPHHGSTDPLILVKVLEYHGIPKKEAMEKLPELKQAMADHFVNNKDKAAIGLEVLPGVRELLQTLNEMENVYVGLCTGNLEPIAWAKMEALGIHHVFSAPGFGGFGSDFCSGNTEESWKDRAQLVRIAADRARAIAGTEMERRFHVGDAPMDVMAAVDAKAHPIGVLTGIFSQEQLSCACPAATIVPDLTDIDHILTVTGIL